ncbi:hypothetical protein AEAC466_20105 [Asticcacaulis sp. AC466]|uniref:HAAS signaling domain-containing protein n=1 Tax=Asticcacaulis sp. AC466 TaxID=1282362 RepID=UPI0003C3B266|nr:hypothetical protein [Asticcacaulis sp. AC466]ESQ81869.1 hypothetical protein AEAC466_20105 [Asticcacaulis sp. AC466]
MDMLEDYLRAVSRLLPRAKREDIIAELRDEILTRIEARESELGRSLTPDETEALLREFGHPIVVAARYRDEPQYSVGTALYPYWIFAVRFAVILEVAISVLVFFGRVIGGANPGEALGTAIGSGITGMMTLIGFATVAAWIIERKGITIDYFNTWRVRDLRFLDFAAWDWTDVSEWLAPKTHRDRRADRRDHSYDYAYDYRPFAWTYRQSSASRGVAAIVIAVVFILWWTGVLSFGLTPIPVDYAAMHVDPGALAQVDYPALKAALYWPVLAYFLVLAAFGAVVLTYPRGVRVRGLFDMAIGLSELGLAAWVWTASPIAAAVHIDSGPALLTRISAFFEHPMPIPLELAATVFLVLFAFIGLCRALGGLWELISGAPRYWGGC